MTTSRVILKPPIAADAPKNSVFQTQLPVAALEALLLLRNLCFHTEAKAHVTANPRALDALVAAAGVRSRSEGSRRGCAPRADPQRPEDHDAASQGKEARAAATVREQGVQGGRRRNERTRAADEHAAKCLDVLVREVLRVGDKRR